MADPHDLARIKRVLIVLGSLTLVTIVALEAFPFVVVALIYRADTRPAQKHRMK